MYPQNTKKEEYLYPGITVKFKTCLTVFLISIEIPFCLFRGICKDTHDEEKLMTTSLSRNEKNGCQNEWPSMSSEISQRSKPLFTRGPILFQVVMLKCVIKYLKFKYNVHNMNIK